VLLVPTLLIADELRKLVVRRRMARREGLGNTEEDSAAENTSGAVAEEGAA